ncbi:hypothetical protein MesoLj131b_73500 (plasmid) [Mesorhizobium sp. 131-2-5]|nr:hypothetical protein MesoLj131b_73500 [Mesorhizobium sp. 131-2-5]
MTKVSQACSPSGRRMLCYPSALELELAIAGTVVAFWTCPFTIDIASALTAKAQQARGSSVLAAIGSQSGPSAGGVAISLVVWLPERRPVSITTQSISASLPRSQDW